MYSFMQICVANLLEPLVTISALVRVASWKDFTFIRDAVIYVLAEFVR